MIRTSQGSSRKGNGVDDCSLIQVRFDYIQLQSTYGASGKLKHEAFGFVCFGLLICCFQDGNTGLEGLLNREGGGAGGKASTQAILFSQNECILCLRATLPGSGGGGGGGGGGRCGGREVIMDCL